MTRTLLLLALSLTCCPLAAQDTTGLTKAAVSRLLAQTEAAVRRHDANMVMAAFSTDARITVVAPARLGGTQQFSASQYREVMIQNWRAYTGLSYEVSNIVITVAADGQSATASDTVTEKGELYGRPVSSVSHERMSIVLQVGKPRIASLYATVSAKGF